MALQLADRSLKYPYGVVEDVLVKVEKFVFLVDFVIMAMEEMGDVPLILGRAFMKTARVLMAHPKVDNLKVRMQDEEVNFDVFKAMTHPKVDKACFQFDMLDEVCMVQEKMAIFTDLIEKCIEVFMADFSVFGDSFQRCLANLNIVLKRCVQINLVLNWEKCHFMVTEGITLGHKISARRIEVDKAKVEVIEKLPLPTNVKGIRSFLGHAGFY
ncbi:uncharacterized protein LOC128196226 [Vigna angularis]|uniref:uncharacterized protein LOC128196226 n=1 Tax=Phaseolus angularis TaxID=3914 RepID=UPI0022B47726|nr:uncharacterized protein LOC128196226 [Vigna angularis]